MDATDNDLLTLLALGGSANISYLLALANAANVRESVARQFSTTTLRPRVEGLVRAGLARFEHDRFLVAPGVKHQTLREAAGRSRLAGLALGVRSVRFDSHTYQGFEVAAGRLSLELEVALLGLTPEARSLLDRALAAKPALEIAADLVFPVLTSPFDAEWFERVPDALKPCLLGLALPFAEVTGQGLGDLYPYLLERLSLLSGSGESVSSLFSVALFAGDFENARAIGRVVSSDPIRSQTLAAALVVAEGSYDRAPEGFLPPKKDEVIGAPRLLQALLLLRDGRAEELAAVRRLATVGSRKGAPFRLSAQVLKSIVDFTLGATPGEFPSHGFDARPESDCLSALFRVLFALWSDLPIVGEIAAQRAAPFASLYEATGRRWLAEQYRTSSARLTKSLVSTVVAKATAQVSAPFDSTLGRPLFELRTEKDRWELDLESLERVADLTAPSAALEAEERVVWRVSFSNLFLEPYLQKRKGQSFTRGRKLAVKHLLSGEPQLARLPAEDRAVAAYARERREILYGYPQVSYDFPPQAWLALVGHPRVELAGSEQPVEVTRGVVQILAHVEGNALLVRLDPAELVSELEVREEGSRLVVYAADERARPLFQLLGSGLRLPLAAKERVLGTLSRLSHLLPVQSSERTTAKAVPADPALWLRIAPRGAGLSVSASVRPLGSAGPELEPGVGARNLQGHAEGEAVQTERNLTSERAALEQWLTRCPQLEGLAAEGTVLLDDPADCLELLSALQSPECSVHVEWPEGVPLRLRGRVSRSALRGRIQRDAGFFFAQGTLEIDAELSLDLAELVALVAQSPGKFARLSNGDFIELERDLQETLELLSSARVDMPGPQRGIALSRGALAALERLTTRDSGFSPDASAAAFLEQLASAFSKQQRTPRALQAELRDYQVEGFRWLARLAEAELGGCLADDMGLGKTLQAIALLLHRAKDGPALVVAPTSVCENWRRELERFAPSLEVRSFAGAERADQLERLSGRTVVIASYALLQQDAEKLAKIEWATAVLDEAQLIKNAESLRAQAACSLRAKARFALTGTPVENHIGDLYSIFYFLLPDLVGSWASFSRRFGAAATGEAGAQARRGLRRLLKPFLLRRTKAQVLDELPELTEIQRNVTLSPAEAALYEGVRLQALSALAEAGSDPRLRLRVLAEITRLRRLCCHPRLVAPDAGLESSKVESFLGLVEELREGRHRALVFSQFVDVLALVRARLDEAGIGYQYLDGSTAPARRTAAVDAFQAGEGDLFLISLKAGGFGLNLTAADYVIHLDPWWNPAVESQASDRAHRIGQTRPVTVYRLIATGTVEERILELHRHKRELADSLLEESHVSARLGPEELRALLER